MTTRRNTVARAVDPMLVHIPIAIVSSRMKSTLAVFITAIWVLRVKLRRIWLSTATGHQDQISLR